MGNRDLVALLFTYAIATLVLIASFMLIYMSYMDPGDKSDNGQAWLAIGTILGYLFRDSGGASAVRNVERAVTAVKDAQPPTT